MSDIYVGEFQLVEQVRCLCEDVCNIAHAYNTLVRDDDSPLEQELRFYLNQKVNILRIYLNQLEVKEQ